MASDRSELIRAAVRDAATFTASRSGGPGGQHVNAAATRVELRVPVAALPLSGAERDRVRGRLGGRITAEDEIRVAIGTERSQLLNRRRAEDVIVELVDEARHAPPTRRPTRPSRASVRRKQAEKARRSQLKAQRSRPPESD